MRNNDELKKLEEITEEEARKYAHERRERISKLETPFTPVDNMELTEFSVLCEKETVPVIHYRQTKQKCSIYPTIFYIPGTAFTGRADKINHMNGSLLMQYSQCQVFLVNHRLAPENKFPAALNDVDHIISHLLQSSKQHGIDTEKIVFAGCSSGATLIVPVTIKYKRNKNDFQPTLMVLIAPLLDLTRAPHEFKYLEEQDEKVNEFFIHNSRKAYVNEWTSFNDPLLSPLFESDLNIQMMPDTILIHGEHDRTRGDAERFANRLTTNGIPFTKHMIPKANHAFFWFDQETVKMVGQKIKDFMKL